ncbi:MAG: hypothetical protein ABI977_14900, partial [Acidobacteriota bacterium]
RRTVLRQVNYVSLSGGGNVIPQLDDYTYDALNRIASGTEAQQNSSVVRAQISMWKETGWERLTIGRISF